MKNETQVSIHPLARFAATLCWENVPLQVQRRAEDLWVDWFGSVLAGQGARPVQSKPPKTMVPRPRAKTSSNSEHHEEAGCWQLEDARQPCIQCRVDPGPAGR